MEHLARLLIVGLAACGGAGTAPAPPPSHATMTASKRAPARGDVAAATARPSAAAAKTPAAAPFVPAPPFSMIARAPGTLELGVFPSSDGDAWVLATDRAVTAWSGARWARVRGRTVDAMPPRNDGLSTRPSLIASRGDVAWLAIERDDAKNPAWCEVFEWSEGKWVSRGRAGRSAGPCNHLAPWTLGSAIAALGAGDDIELAVVGKRPSHVPLLADPPKGTGTLAHVSVLRAWDDGEVLVVGTRASPTPALAIHRWSGRSARSIVGEVPLDYNAPYVSMATSKDDVWIDGIGMLGDEPKAVRYVSKFEGGRHRRASMTEHDLCDLETMLVSGPSRVGVSEASELESFAVEGETIYAVVATGGETLLLRNRPVDRTLAIAP